MLKLPKHLLPDFSRPGVKPTGPVALDYTDSATNGLVAGLYYLDRKPSRNLCGPDATLSLADNVMFNNQRFRDSGRESYLIDTTSTRTMYVPYHNLSSGSVRIVGEFSYTGVGGTFSLRTGTTTADTLIWRNGGNNKVGFRINGSTVTMTLSKSLYNSGIHDLVVQWDSTTNTREIWLDGKLEVRNTITGFTWKDNAPKRAYFYYDSAGAGKIYGWQRLAELRNRMLSQVEVMRLYREPYAAIKPANDFYYFPLQSGGFESHSGNLVSSGACSVLTVGSKTALNDLASVASCAIVLSGAKAAVGVMSSFATSATNLTGFAAFLGQIVSSALSQTVVTGSKADSKSGSLISSAVVASILTGAKSGAGVVNESATWQTVIAGIKSALGIVASTNASVTSVIGAADGLIYRSGFAVSSSVSQALVTGFKAVLGAASSNNSVACTLLAFAAKSGVLVSLSNVVTLVVGYNPASETPMRKVTTFGQLADYHLHGVVNTHQIKVSL